MPFKLLQRLWGRQIFLTLVLATIYAPAFAQQWEIKLDAQPNRISADGRSTSQITIDLSSPQTGPAPDNTEVRFQTTAGSIVPVARVVGGKATAVLTSTTTRNFAQVTAIVGGQSATVQVEFVAGDFQTESVMLTFIGELGYSTDKGVLIAADASVTHGDLRISADTLEFDESQGQVRGQGNVVVSRDEISIAADAVTYKPEDGTGWVLITGRVPQEVAFRSDTLSIQTPRPTKNLLAYDAFQAKDTRTWITASRAVVFPRERIQFTQAEVRVGGRPVLALPHYFYDYRGNSLNPISQQFRYTSYEGMVMDLPFYFQFKENSSAAVRLRYAGKGSSYGSYATPRKGFTLGMEQTYSAPGGGGRFFADSFMTSGRLLEWNHTQTLSAGRRLSGSLRYQPRTDFAKNAVSGFGSYGWKSAGFDMTFATYGSSSQSRVETSALASQSSVTTRLDARSPGHAISGTGLSWRTNLAVVQGPLYTNGFSNNLHNGLYESVGIGLAHRPVPMPLGATFSMDSSLERSFGARSTNSLRGRAILAKALGQSGDVSLTWEQDLLGGNSLSSPYQKSLTGALSAGKPNGMRGYAFFTWLPDDKSTYLTATVSRPLTKKFRMEASHNFSRVDYNSLGVLSTSSFRYSRVSLIRPIGLFEVSLNFSPQGRDYGLKNSKTVWFEFGSRAF